MGLFYLVTLYCFIRGAASNAPPVWYGFSVAACAMGMISKEVMVSAPLMLLLYDRTFVSGSFREAWSRRRRFYLLLVATWPLLAVSVFSAGTEGDLRGFGAGVSVAWWVYALTQLRAVVHYLRLSVWPHPLVLDYGSDLVVHIAEVIPQAITIVLLLVSTAIALWRWPSIGFVATWFFVILAPSSSVVPLATQTMAEHRMYLPLAAVAVLVVTGGYQLLAFAAGHLHLQALSLRYTAVAAVGLLVVTLGWLTLRRNEDYQSQISIWADTVAKRPQNAGAHYNLGLASAQEGRIEQAMTEFEQALRLKSNYADAYWNLGVSLEKVGRAQEAMGRYEQALRVKPNWAEGHYYVGMALTRLGRMSEAIAHYEQALQINPDYADAHNSLAYALIQSGRIQDAIEHYEAALRIEPGSAQAHNNLAGALYQVGRAQDAIWHLEQALRIKPDFAEAKQNLERVRASQ